MAANTGALAGKTLFISGASRGIGKAVALKAARDGANIVIAAKTGEPHPKLPGTIYTAAKEVEEAGGKALPCLVDIRYEDQVERAMEEAANKFGGIDILVNNASAISLTGTAETDMKRYDLMMEINTRGTYLCSKKALPYLKKGRNPHILNMSPPLNMKPKWFQNHAAYTMAKYGMTMCALGMAEEFRPLKIAVNTLWPRTAIYTAAMEMLGAGTDIRSQCRIPEILSDAAYIILSKDSDKFTGNFVLDDLLLRDAGVTDLTPYSCVPGSKLMVDFFLDDDPLGAAGGASGQTQAAPSGGVASTLQTMKSLINPDIVKSINGIFLFDLKGEEAGTWYLDLKTGDGDLGEGNPPAGEPGCTMTMDSGDFVKMFKGEIQSTNAFMTGKLKIQGDMMLGMKLEKLLGQVKSKL